ncbi:MAG: 4a-hydroxytetrahydrobiopterin dehydratase [Candidatus Eremiobacteraeota bacterium]|nr:4a-hydroxytetrahydrobiopterin dehydratase [Candidatus Eremiobacteraeota bacterium]
MQNLTSQQCQACRADAPQVTAEEREQFSQQVPDWKLVTVDGIERLQRVFKFKNFVEALDFTNQVGALAERENHHPRLVTEWGVVTVEWWTHKIKGLHRNDFIAAAKTDSLLSR